MAEISALKVKELREKTGAGMMDCKQALAETGGDIETAVDWLRKKGLAKAAKKAGRVAAEGLIGASVEGGKGVLVEVNSETDFVARNEQFQGLVKMITHVALSAKGDVEATKTAKVGNGTVADAIGSAIATIGENISLRRAALIETGQGTIGAYLHNSIAPGLGKIGTLVALESKGKADELSELARKLAMHVAASNPQALDAKSLDKDLIARERAVLAEKARAAGKPDNVIEKIVEGGLKTFYKEVCLVDQAYIHDPAKSVSQAVKETEGRIGAPVAIKAYVRYALGEGIEKQD